MSDVKELNINNTTYDIKAKSVVDTNSGKLKFWSGTRQEYDAIGTKDTNTLYNITDDNTADAYQAYTKSEVDTLLNGKASINLTNVTDTAKIAMAEASMPSSTYTDLTLGASASTYTAPADGWFTFSKQTNDINQWLYLKGPLMSSELKAPNSGTGLTIFLPVQKGDSVKVGYSAGGNTNFFRFIYAVGSESEAS